MSDIIPYDKQVEGTQFYKRGRLSAVLRIILITVVVFICVSILSFWLIADIGARHAYKEARDIRRALRAVGVEYYGDTTSIFDPDSPDGLTEGAADKIKDLSTRTGDVFLYEWDDLANAPVRFEYRTGLYRVIYTDTGAENGITTGVEGDFNIYYSFEILRFEAE